jgi:hypothetical protein
LFLKDFFFGFNRKKIGKNNIFFLLEGNKLGRVSGTNTGTTVLDGLVRDGELGKVVTSHLRLDFNLVENLTVVDTNDGTNHLGNNDHVTEVGLYDLGLLTSGGVLLGSTELLDETHGLTLKTTLESSTSTTVNELHELEQMLDTVVTKNSFYVFTCSEDKSKSCSRSIPR